MPNEQLRMSQMRDGSSIGEQVAKLNEGYSDLYATSNKKTLAGMSMPPKTTMIDLSKT